MSKKTTDILKDHDCGGIMVIPDSPKTPEEIAKWLKMAAEVKLPEVKGRYD